MADQTIIVDLDAIFDTRIGTIAGIDTIVAAELIANPVYRNRKNNVWEEISGNKLTTSAFMEAYAKRNKETLKMSPITSFPKEIGGFTKKLQWRSVVKVDVKRVFVKINTWPYKFSSEEKSMLRDCLSLYFSATSSIEYIHVPLADMTPKVLDDLGDIWITYAHDEWMTLHMEKLLAYRIPMMTILAPKILFNPNGIKEDDLTNEEGMFDPFKVYQVMMAEYVGIDFYTPDTFCSVLD